MPEGDQVVVGKGKGYRAQVGKKMKHWGNQLEKERLGGAVPGPRGPSPRQDMPHKRCRKEETLMVKTRHRHGVKGSASGVTRYSIYFPTPIIPFTASCHILNLPLPGLGPTPCLFEAQVQG